MKIKLFAILIITSIILSSCGASGDYAPEMIEADGIMLPSYDQKEDGTTHDTTDFGKIIENEFISTSTQNVSTLSADVDTASYAYFRKLVNMGYSTQQLISTTNGSLRTEEFINYFDYSYKEPQENDLFGMSANAFPCPWNEDSIILSLALKASDGVDKTKNNLVFLIDVSGSMYADDKLGLLQKSFTYLTGSLTENDTVSIVTYAGNEKIVLDGAKGNEKDKIIKAINDLEAGGSTNGESGLKTAYALAEKYMKPDCNNRIIMASDGDLNVGISSADELKAFVEQKRDLGIFLSVLGFGTGNYKDSAMEALADNGNGIYYYIDGEREAQKVLQEELFSTLYPVAKDVKLQLTFNADTVDQYRLIGYENRLLNKDDFDNDTKDAGELGAGHAVTVCYELKLKSGESTDTDELLKLAVRYKKPNEEMSVLDEYQIKSDVYDPEATDEQKFLGAVIECTMILRESKFTNGKTLNDVLSTLNSLDLSGNADKYEFRQLVSKLTDR